MLPTTHEETMMARNPCTTIFDHANPGHLEVKHWRSHGPHCWEVYARQYARQYGEAKAWKADDSVVRFWNDDGTIRQRTYHKVVHTQA